MPEERLLTIKDVVRRTSLGRSTVFALIASGDLPSFTIGRSRRVRESILDAWIERRSSLDVSAPHTTSTTPVSDPSGAAEQPEVRGGATPTG
jgi:excisionase family DNA binding protein